MSTSSDFSEAGAFRTIVEYAIRSLIPHMPSWEKTLFPSIDAITDEMIATANLPEPIIIALGDFGHMLVRAAEQMGAAQAKIDEG